MNDKYEILAKLFHHHYERLAPLYSYDTRDETRVDWDFLPENNKKLMIETIKHSLNELDGYMDPVGDINMMDEDNLLLCIGLELQHDETQKQYIIVNSMDINDKKYWILRDEDGNITTWEHSFVFEKFFSIGYMEVESE
jgi:hypothetical protein